MNNTTNQLLKKTNFQHSLHIILLFLSYCFPFICSIVFLQMRLKTFEDSQNSKVDGSGRFLDENTGALQEHYINEKKNLYNFVFFFINSL